MGAGIMNKFGWFAWYEDLCLDLVGMYKINENFKTGYDVVLTALEEADMENSTFPEIASNLHLLQFDQDNIILSFMNKCSKLDELSLLYHKEELIKEYNLIKEAFVLKTIYEDLFYTWLKLSAMNLNNPYTYEGVKASKNRIIALQKPTFNRVIDQSMKIESFRREKKF